MDYEETFYFEKDHEERFKHVLTQVIKQLSEFNRIAEEFVKSEMSKR